MTSSGFEITESDCCGNGCANCILDSVPARIVKSDLQDRTNILHSYNAYQLLSTREIKPNILQMHFKCFRETADPSLVLYVPPGHHIMMRAPNTTMMASIGTGSDAAFVTRPYSPFWTELDNLEFKILVNLSPNGVMSKYIKNLETGHLVDFRGPIGSFQHQPKLYDFLLLFCHGVAIAPIFAIIREILNDEEDMTRVRLFACFENIQSILFREELYAMNSYWNFHGRMFLSRLQGNFNDIVKYKEDVNNFRLNHDEIKTIISGCKDLSRTRSIICGSKLFQENVKDMLMKEGLKEDFVYIL